ncbi:MAG: hypothetical protein DKINENOH_04783 [bacterium]|nr:hypothetical protein [bacterium]
MPGDAKGSWKRFVGGLRTFLADLPEHRHQDQFLAFREAALALAESDKMQADIQEAYDGSDVPEPLNVVLQELDAFPLAVSVHEAEVKAGTAKPGAKKALCSAAKTILGSVDNVFSLSPFARVTVAVLKEAVELFSGD